MTDVEYQLKILLKSTTLQVTGIKDINDPVASQSFKKKYCATRKIFAFIKNNASIAKTNIEIPVFCVPINFNELQHKLIYCEVAVGDSLYVTKDYSLMCQPPSGYDSFIVKSEVKEEVNFSINENNYLDDNYRREMKNINDTYSKEMSLRNTSGKTNYSPRKPESPKQGVIEDLSSMQIDPESFSYIIKDPSKINLLYEVSFNYDRMLEQKQKGQCEMCQKNPSVMFCLAERASFCKYCEESIHDNEFTRRHQRYYYDSPDKKKKFISCAFHYDSIVDFYCEACNAPVCSACKIHGNHSTPPFSNHKLIKFLDACDIIKEKMANEENEICTMAESIKNNICVYKKDMEEFNKMVALTRSKIETEYRNALNELTCIERKRLQCYNAIYIEKIVGLERCERIHSYIKESEGGQNVKDYKTILEQKEQIKVKEVRIPLEKIVLDGYLNLYTEGKDKGERNRKMSDQYVEAKSAR
ncbi:hypothetical protein GVAV_003554 [Gurleya vavrai]